VHCILIQITDQYDGGGQFALLAYRQQFIGACLTYSILWHVSSHWLFGLLHLSMSYTMLTL